MRRILRIYELAQVWVPEIRDFPVGRENAGRMFAKVTTPAASAYLDLKRYLSIPKRWIFVSKVESGIPNLAAAPAGPDIRPRL